MLTDIHSYTLVCDIKTLFLQGVNLDPHKTRVYAKSMVHK